MSYISSKQTTVFIFLTLLFGCLLVQGHRTDGATDKELVEAARHVSPAVVKVEAYDNNREQLRAGSGFIVQEDGEVVSNFHVVQGASQIIVTSRSGRAYPVQKVVESDAGRDYVLLKIDASKLPFVRLGNVSRIRSGERVIAIGHQFLDGFTISSGTFNGHREENSQQWLQHTALIAPGSSGGPLINQHGEVIGINTAYASGYKSLSFAIPIDEIQISLLSAIWSATVVYIRDCLQYLRSVTL